MLLTADRIHNGHTWLPDGSVIEINETGVITAIHDSEQPGAVHYQGVLAPGFVNTHCHLELSHMKGAIPEHTGLIPFLQKVMMRRNGFTDEQKTTARQEAFTAMYANGVVAVGDIANTTDTLDLRASGRMYFHSFVESIGFTETPQKQFGWAQQVYDAFAAQPSSTNYLSQSIVPHAPYSVSHVLFGMIDRHNGQSIISIHNQESRAEDEYYLLKEGGIQTLLQGLGIDDAFFKPSGKSSLQTYLEWLSPTHPFIFVHNTYTGQNDIQVAKALLPDVYWCLCPNANLYIENALPDIDLLVSEDANLCIGTDSLSSNHQLCILSELYTIKQHYPHISWETLLNWGTYNGAYALKMHDITGSLTVGMQPGILQITGLDTNAKPAITRIQ
jgi:aminodeoxyfutalosine deaminase